MDAKLTERLKAWLDAPEDERDFDEGCLLLLKLSNKRILVSNIQRNPASGKGHLVYHLTKYYNFRVSETTKEEVREMSAKVKAMKIQERNTPGKRDDHDSLPDDIQALYKENADIMQRMKYVHMKMQDLRLREVTCPESELYPYVEELCTLDDRYQHNWEVYDRYSPKSGEELMLEQRQSDSIKGLRFVNLNKGRYAKNPTPELKEKILAAYASIINPAPALTAQLRELGILD